MREPLSGEMNRRATFFSIKHVPSGDSDLLKNGQTLFHAWVKVEVVGGLVYWENAQTSDAVTHRIFVRYVKDRSRPQDFSRITVIRIGDILYRAKRVTDVNESRRFTMLECEVLGHGS